MRKLGLLLALLSLMIVPVIAQDDAETDPEATEDVSYDCTTIGINRQVDEWYNTYFVARGEFDTEQARTAAQVFSDQVEELVLFCENAPVEENVDENVEAEELVIVEQTGIGTFDAPYVYNGYGIVGDTTILITRGLRPANDVIFATEIAGVETITDDQEYVLLDLTINCILGSSGCRISENSFRLVGDMGQLYAPILTQIDSYLPQSALMLGGSEEIGVLPFLIDKADTTLRLVYYPEGDALDAGAMGFYYQAIGDPETFEVSSTVNQLNIRNAPRTNGAPVGVLRGNQVATANARNADTTWIRIEAPEGTGWVSAEFIETESDLESLTVVEE